MNPDVARFVTFAAGQPIGQAGDEYILAAAAFSELDVLDYRHVPIAAPFPAAGY